MQHLALERIFAKNPINYYTSTEDKVAAERMISNSGNALCAILYWVKELVPGLQFICLSINIIEVSSSFGIQNILFCQICHS